MSPTTPRKAVLLINLGSPQNCTIPDIRHFLGEFLTDPDVITLKSPFRQILFRGIVAPIRSRKILQKYQAIWHKSGRSPLHYHTEAIEEVLESILSSEYVVISAMRYQQPSIQQACKELSNYNLEELFVIPLFPQEAKETTGSIYNQLKRVLSKYPNVPTPKLINNYFAAPWFISAMKDEYQPLLDAFEPDLVLLSYHGLPNQSIKPFCTEQCVLGGFQMPCHAEGGHVLGPRSCYRAQCYATSRALINAIDLKDCQTETVFQSRFGPLKWIGPGLLQAMEKHAQEGKKRMAIACPSFVTDCLETLEEVNLAAREYWLELGGEDFLFLPCVNAQETFVKGLAQSIKAFE